MNEEVRLETVHINSRADELIACLEGEIAKRDARIVELESDLAGTQSRVLSLQDQWRKLDAELAAIKAQEPAARQFQARDGSRHPFISEQHYQNTLADGWPIRALYAAPVSEAKAQGVVLTDEELCSIRNQVACNEVRRDDDSRTICVKHGRALEAAVLARLNAAPVQQVSVPDGWKLVPVELTREMAKAVGDLAERKWCYCLTAANVCEIFSTVLAAAPAAPAADAGLVEARKANNELVNDLHVMTNKRRQLVDALTYLRECLDPDDYMGEISMHDFIDDALAAHRAQGVV